MKKAKLLKELKKYNGILIQGPALIGDAQTTFAVSKREVRAWLDRLFGENYTGWRIRPSNVPGIAYLETHEDELYEDAGQDI